MPAIAEFNRRRRKHHVVHLEIVPEPYLGNPNAAVILLNLNPGFVEDDRSVHLQPLFNRAARANLLHCHPNWPFYLLDPSLPASPGRDWWRKKLAHLITAVGSQQAVAGAIFVAELHGYHTRRFHHGLKVPSQQYTFSLVKKAIKRGAHLVLMRGRRAWLRDLPELAGVPIISLRNPQNPTISIGNCPEQFETLVRAIQKYPSTE